MNDGVDLVIGGICGDQYQVRILKLMTRGRLLFVIDGGGVVIDRVILTCGLLVLLDLESFLPGTILGSESRMFFVFSLCFYCWS